MTDVPPARYRVTERGRRLEVVDTWAAARPASIGADRASVARREKAPPLGSIVKTSFDGRAELTTNALYDLNGPRTIKLDPVSAKVFAGTRTAAIVLLVAWIVAAAFVPALLVLGVPLLSPRTWKQVRGKSTAWLDRAAAGAA